jgi:hypothetical protein
VVNEVAELAAVTRRASRVGVEHHVTASRHQLFFEVETGAIIGERPAVNLQDQRVTLCGIEVRRLDDPALNSPLVFRRFVPDFFDLAELPVP